MPYRILHLSDLHLDRAFSGVGCQGDVARRRRLDLRDALRRAGDAAQQHGCDLITIGGDLYESERSGPDTGRFLSETFAEWAPMRVVIAPGNHDPYMPASLYARVDWPENVKLFTEPVLQPFELDDGLILWGLAHREPSWQGDPLEGDPLASNAGARDTHIALFHGSEMGSRPEGKSVHGPFRADRVAGCGFRLALSGHYHRRRVDREHGLVYPGSPEPLTFDESGGRGPVIVEIDGTGGVTYTALDLNVWNAVSVACDMSGSTSVSGVFDTASRSADAAVAGLDGERTMLRVDITGSMQPTVGIDIFTMEGVLRQITGAAVVKVRDASSPAIDVASAATDATARGAFTRTLLEAVEAASDPDERDLLQDALRYGLQALSGVEVGLR